MSKVSSLFISYSRVDADAGFVEHLEAELSRYGYETWRDHQLRGGQEWEREIETQIKRADYMLVVLTPASVAEDSFVRNEYLYALSIKKPLIPILARSTGVPVSITKFQYIDFTQGFPQGMDALRARLADLSEGRGPSQPTSAALGNVRQDPIVVLPPQPPQPNPALESIYRSARRAFATQDWDTAEAQLNRVVSSDPGYDGGRAATDLATARSNLIPLQVSRQRAKADAAHRAGQWRQEIAYWNSVLSIDPNNAEAKTRVQIATQNQNADPTYQRAAAFAKSWGRGRDVKAAREELERLQQIAPYYGDPENLAPIVNMKLAPNYLDYLKQQKVASSRQRAEAEEIRVKNQKASERLAKANVRKARWQRRGEITRRTFVTGFSLAAIGAAGFGAYKVIHLISYNNWQTSTDSGRQLEVFTPHFEVNIGGIGWSTDGSMLVTSYEAGAWVWHPDGSQAQAYSAPFVSCYGVAWSPIDHRIAIARGDQLAEVWSSADGQGIAQFSGHSNIVRCVAWSPKGDKVVSGSDDHTAQIWKASDASPVQSYKGHKDTVGCVAWSPDGTMVATGSVDHTAQIWSVADAKTLVTYTQHTGNVNAIAWSADGTLIATASDDHTVQIWSATDGSRLHTYIGHSGAVRCISWAPHGALLASGGNDHTAQVWSVASGTLLTYTGHSDNVTCIEWSPDGTRLVSGSDDNSSQIWRMAASDYNGI